MTASSCRLCYVEIDEQMHHRWAVGRSVTDGCLQRCGRMQHGGLSGEGDAKGEGDEGDGRRVYSIVTVDRVREINGLVTAGFNCKR